MSHVLEGFNGISKGVSVLRLLKWHNGQADHIRTMIETPVIVVNRESLPRIGGYGSGYMSIVTVVKAASEYLSRGHFAWKEEAKTLLNQAKKAARDCINGMDDTN